MYVIKEYVKHCGELKVLCGGGWDGIEWLEVAGVFVIEGNGTGILYSLSNLEKLLFHENSTDDKLSFNVRQIVCG